MSVRSIEKILWLMGILGISLVMCGGVTQASWTFEVMGGSSVHAAIPISITQEGYPVLKLTPLWKTHPFEEAPYYSWRVGKWDRDTAWEFELIHDKMILGNPTSEVTHFEVSHGYNYLLINRAAKLDTRVLRLGAGLILSHPESTVRGQAFGDFDFLQGFYISGVGAQAGVQYNVQVYGPVYLLAEAKLTGAWARVLVAGGSADVPALALHGLLGLGYRW